MSVVLAPTLFLESRLVTTYMNKILYHNCLRVVKYCKKTGSPLLVYNLCQFCAQHYK